MPSSSKHANDVTFTEDSLISFIRKIRTEIDSNIFQFTTGDVPGQVKYKYKKDSSYTNVWVKGFSSNKFDNRNGQNGATSNGYVYTNYIGASGNAVTTAYIDNLRGTGNIGESLSSPYANGYITNLYGTSLGSKSNPWSEAYITNLGSSDKPVNQAYIKNLSITAGGTISGSPTFSGELTITSELDATRTHSQSFYATAAMPDNSNFNFTGTIRFTSNIPANSSSAGYYYDKEVTVQGDDGTGSYNHDITGTAVYCNYSPGSGTTTRIIKAPVEANVWYDVSSTTFYIGTVTESSGGSSCNPITGTTDWGRDYEGTGSCYSGSSTYVSHTGTTFREILTKGHAVLNTDSGTTKKFKDNDMAKQYYTKSGNTYTQCNNSTDYKSITQFYKVIGNKNDPGLGIQWGAEGTMTLTGSITTRGGIAAGKSIKGYQVHAAVFNDYAEYRQTDSQEPGRCVIEVGDGNMTLSSKRLQPGANIVSDTFGFSIGETYLAQTPIAVCGRVLAYPLEDKQTYEPGDAVCSGPNGTISKMTREEIREWPDRIIGYVSEIPNYEIWGSDQVEVNGRIWIKIK